MKRISQIIILGLLILSYPACAGLRVFVSNEWLSRPEAPISLQFADGEADKTYQAEITDFGGEKIMTCSLEPKEKLHILKIAKGLPNGYYRVTIAGEGVWGLMVAPDYQGEPDTFYGIDAFFSWYVCAYREDWDQGEKRKFFQTARRFGIFNIRDRLSWAGMQSDKDTFNTAKFDFIRELAPAVGVNLLEAHHSCPNWIREGQPHFPRNLHAAADFWRRLGEHYKKSWSAVESWNEPELGGSNQPGDQLIPGLKAMSYGLQQSVPQVELGNAAFTSAKVTQFLRVCAENGVVDYSDFISFHTYTPQAEALVDTVAAYRDWLAANGREGLPLEITEIGRAGIGALDSKPEEMDEIAAVTAMQATVSRATGIRKIYFFCMLSLDEGARTFGLFGRQRTPRSSFAALATNVRMLGNTSFRGSAKGIEGKAKSALVFRGKSGDIVVWEQLEGGQAFQAPFKIIRAVGMDGRELKADTGGMIKARDPFVYLVTQLPDAAVDSDTEEYRLYTRAQKPYTPGRTTSAVIAFPHSDMRAVGTFSIESYAIEADKDVPVNLELFNMTAQKREVVLEAVPNDLKLVQGKQRQTLTLDPEERRKVPFAVRMTQGQAKKGGYYDLRFTIKGNGVDDRAMLCFSPFESGEIFQITTKPGKKIDIGGKENWRNMLPGQPRNDREDLDASFRISYTPDALMLDMEVTDDIHFNNFQKNEMWKGDSLQVGVQAGTAQNLGERSRFTEICFALTADGPVAYRYQGQFNQQKSGECNFPFEITRSGTTTHYNLKIPAAELGLKGFKAGDRVRLGLVVNENDGFGRRGVLSWGDGISSMKSPERFKILQLK